MKLRTSLAHTIVLALLLSASVKVTAQAALRVLQPDDLFRVRHIGATAWSPDGLYAAIQITRPGQTLDTEIPSAELAILDVKKRTLRTITPDAPTYLGFFNAIWSPDGQRLAFLSVDSNAAVQLWVWKSGMQNPAPVRDLDVKADLNDRSIAWIADDRIAVLAWDAVADRSGNLYFRILRGRNVADGWSRAFGGQSASVSVLRSPASSCAPSAQLIVVDIETDARKTLANGCLHNLTASPDGRFIAFSQERSGQAASSYFDLAGSDVDQAYMAVNRGTENHVIDAASGAQVSASLMPVQPKTPAARPMTKIPPPRAEARKLSESPTGDASLYAADVSDGSHLWICGEGSDHAASCSEIWHANEWVQEIETGTAEHFSYSTADGKPLVGWLLLPHSYQPGRKLPIVTIIYPGLVYSASKAPSSFSLFWTNLWQAPQLFAALGYGVLLPSMPEAANQTEIFEHLPDGVIPAIDAIITRGIADPDRIAIVGQSDGGFGVLGLITQTNRFRSAISSAGFSDLTSLYGTFYGQYRYGDAGPPQKAQFLRMLQMEKGSIGLGGPPWREADKYLAASPVLRADKVQTPLMLIHGDIDFIPIQQDEEFFTALLRQNKRAEFVRYQGEWHTISAHANVLDLWKRVADWLAETMPARK